MTTKPPLVLLHGVTNSARIWDDVVPLLDETFELLVPTAAGHRGGPPDPGGLTIARLVDDVETLLDDHGLHQAHLAGNSMGGWMALELARRGRALSVCALSPAGCWSPGADDETHATGAIRRGRRVAAAALPVAPVALRSGRIRRIALRDAAERADRLTPAQALGVVRDLVGCSAATDLLGTTEQVAPLTPSCPVTLAWAERDRIFPPAVNGVTAQRLVPDATYLELPAVGHVPMIDDPRLCASVIRQACGVPQSRSGAGGER